MRKAHGQQTTDCGCPRPGIVRTPSNGGSVIPLRKKDLKLKRESTRYPLYKDLANLQAFATNGQKAPSGVDALGQAKVINNL
jgi:hypothetical protein